MFRATKDAFSEGFYLGGPPPDPHLPQSTAHSAQNQDHFWVKMLKFSSFKYGFPTVMLHLSGNFASGMEAIIFHAISDTFLHGDRTISGI